MDLRFKTAAGNFELRAAAVVIHQNRLLVMQDDVRSYYYLPGGAVSLNETGAEALQRELSEELGIEAEIGRLLWVTEDLFIEDTEHKRFHHISFYYDVDVTALPDDLLANDFEFNAPEGLLRFYWKNFAEMQKLYFYPEFLRHKVSHLPLSPQHLIIRKDT